MQFELFIALRYLFARHGQAFISVISWLSVAGVAIGVASMIIAMGVMNGFTTDLRDKIIGATAHIILFNVSPLEEDPQIIEDINSTAGVVGATPFIYSELMLSSSTGVKGIVLRGIDPKTAPNVIGALDRLVEGSAQALSEDEGLPGVIVGRDMANRLNLHVGSRVNLLAPSGQQSSAGFNPRIKPYRVVGVFSLGLYEYDSSLVFVSLDSARELLGWPGKQLTGIEVAVNDVDKADVLMERVITKIGPSQYYGRTWMSMNVNLFAALKLEKMAMAILLTIVVIIASFSIVTALVMLVMEKTRDIAVLMSLGATSGAVKRIFMLQGMIIGLMGTAVGSVLGIVISRLISQYKLIELPPGVYSLDYLHVLLDPFDIGLTIAGALVICFFATLYPANKASRLEPVDALRQE